MADRFELRERGMDDALALLKALPAELVSRRGGPVKSALRKGAVVLFKQAKLNLQASVQAKSDEEAARSTGLLAANLVVTRGKAPTSGNGERYLVRVRRKSYQRAGKEPVTTLKSAQLLEYGSSEQPPEPWLRPAFETRKGEAVQVVQVELVRGLERVVKKYLKGVR